MSQRLTPESGGAACSHKELSYFNYQTTVQTNSNNESTAPRKWSLSKFRVNGTADEGKDCEMRSRKQPTCCAGNNKTTRPQREETKKRGKSRAFNGETGYLMPRGTCCPSLGMTKLKHNRFIQTLKLHNCQNLQALLSSIHTRTRARSPSRRRGEILRTQGWHNAALSESVPRILINVSGKCQQARTYNTPPPQKKSQHKQLRNPCTHIKP